MSSALFFPDTTVITSFALIGGMDLLKQLVNGNGAWCATVSQECGRGARKPGLAEMSRARDIFGDPLWPTPAEKVDTFAVQTALAEPEDPSHRHLGESETLAIVAARGLRAVFVTDDRGARRHAKTMGIITYDTWDILRMAVVTRRLTADDFLAAYEVLLRHRRGHPPCDRDIVSVRAWLQPAG